MRFAMLNDATTQLYPLYIDIIVMVTITIVASIAGIVFFNTQE